MRPGDPNETVAAWRLAVERRDGPVGFGFTRQKVPVLPGTAELAADGVRRGGYILVEAADAAGTATAPDLILIATGSELSLAMAAREMLEREGIRTRVVSLPCWERFAAQSAAYREMVLPADRAKRVSIEAGVSLGWDRWVGPEGAMVCIERFGASAPAADIFEAFGFTPDAVAHVARSVLTGTIRGIVSPDPDPAGPGSHAHPTA